MPRATFAGVTFDFLLDGLQDTHEGMTTVREVPGGHHAPTSTWAGPCCTAARVTIRVDSEADYLTLAALPGTSGASGSLTQRRRGGRPGRRAAHRRPHLAPGHRAPALPHGVGLPG